MGHAYSNEFFDYVALSSRRSAAAVVPYVKALVEPRSILDVGCGRGVWLERWRTEGMEITGVDGSYVDTSTLAIPESAFVRHDLSGPFDLGRRFDLAQCLEVAEHIPERSADSLVDSITRHADIVLFSAAVPGQGGEHHINEQPIDYWRAKFQARGFAAYDAVRPMVQGRSEVAPWYRFNALLYANQSGETRLNPVARLTRLREGEKVPELGSFTWRARCLVLKSLPVRAIDALAWLTHQASLLSHRTR